MNESLLTGRVIRLQSGFYTISFENKEFTCKLRGRLKKGSTREDIVAIGDLVSFSILSDGSGIIEDIKPRHRTLERMAPAARGNYRQILLANIDQVVIVFAFSQPEPHLRMLDRFLVIAEKQQIPPLIIVNKIDLFEPGTSPDKSPFSIYEDLDYPVLYTSAVTGCGVMELYQGLEGKLSALVGPSGVGKTSLLKAMHRDLEIPTKKISQSTSKGRHSTVVRTIYALNHGGYVADLPGLRSLSFWDIEPEELDGYFREFRPLVSKCQFNDCTHHNEPDCAIRAAVNEGTVHAERYESYLRLRFGENYDKDNTSYHD